jgi:hypothetical protein
MSAVRGLPRSLLQTDTAIMSQPTAASFLIHSSSSVSHFTIRPLFNDAQVRRNSTVNGLVVVQLFLFLSSVYFLPSSEIDELSRVVRY